jgi:hypothetical protein
MPHKRRIRNVAPVKHRLGSNGPFETARQIVDDDDMLAVIQQLPDHVTADIAGSAGDEHRHRPTPVWLDSVSGRHLRWRSGARAGRRDLVRTRDSTIRQNLDAARSSRIMRSFALAEG